VTARCWCLVVAGLLLQGTGCVVVDCAFTYHYDGVLVDPATGAVREGVKMAVQAGRFDPHVETDDWPGFRRTDERGRFSGSFSTGLSWGYTVLLGFVVRGSRTGPTPPEIDSVTVTVQRSDGDWDVVRRAVPPGRQRRSGPAERWLELDTVMTAAVDR